MKRRSFFAVLVSACGLRAQDQGPKKNVTDGVQNGFSWMRMSQPQQSLYLLGVMDTTRYWDQPSRNAGLPEKAELSGADLHFMITEFFQDTANCKIQIIFSLIYIRAKVEGHHPLGSLENVLRYLRNQAEELYK